MPHGWATQHRCWSWSTMTCTLSTHRPMKKTIVSQIQGCPIWSTTVFPIGCIKVKKNINESINHFNFNELYYNERLQLEIYNTLYNAQSHGSNISMEEINTQKCLRLPPSASQEPINLFSKKIYCVSHCDFYIHTYIYAIYRYIYTVIYWRFSSTIMWHRKPPRWHISARNDGGLNQLFLNDHQFIFAS